MKKRLIALILFAALSMGVFASCASIKPTDADKGAEIPVYFCDEIYTLDPAFAYNNEASIKILGLIYEGLFSIDEKGNVEKALCKSYSSGTNADGDFYMTIDIKDTKWSDGRSVSANDFVFAFKRILEPEFASEAASMLFDIKNARACKAGDISIDDLGVVASETKQLEITFEKEIDVDRFISYLASPALVPLREDKVARLTDWASYYVTMVSNGPFYVKVYEPGTDVMTLERNIYYFRDTENEDEKLDKYVVPFRLLINYENDSKKQLEAFEKDEIVFDEEIPLDKRSDYAGKVKTQDLLNTCTYYLNTEKAPFDDADVRRALSLAIDRNELVDIVKYAKPAEGVVPEGVFNTDKKTSFRGDKEGGKLIEASADLDEAKSLAKKAKVKEFTLTIRDNDVDREVAKYVKGQWEKIGFKVEIRELGFEHYENIEYNQYRDLFNQAYYSRDFDVIAIDNQALSTDAFTTLAAFAKNYSGGAMDLSSGNFDAVTHITGYDDEKYETTIDNAFNESDPAKRASYLHEAEKQLIEDMPVIPLFVYQDAYLISGDMKGVVNTYFGYHILKDVRLSGYERFKSE
ncbi:MAG: peptide ABC transporter substrate-binding protein [Clostridia bacterium]|nr:peptide ABC transporter substrate-binding protein [Clostridia bacterium]